MTVSELVEMPRSEARDVGVVQRGRGGLRRPVAPADLRRTYPSSSTPASMTWKGATASPAAPPPKLRDRDDRPPRSYCAACRTDSVSRADP